MTIASKWPRRSFVTAVLSSAGALLAPRSSWARPKTSSSPTAAPALSGFGSTGNVYDELGVTTVINGQGTMTVLGGSLMRPEVEAAMALAGRHFVSIPDLEVAAGKRIAEMLKLPNGYSALVTSGAAAAMQSGLAGILTGNNPQFIKQLPDLTGMKSEVIIQKSHRNPFDHQLRATGIRLVEVETREDVAKAVSDKTAMMHFSNFANPIGQIKVDEWVKLGSSTAFRPSSTPQPTRPQSPIFGITRRWDTTSSLLVEEKRFADRNVPAYSWAARISLRTLCSITALMKTRWAAARK